MQVGTEIKSQDGAASDFALQVKYIAPSARPPARSPAMKRSKYARDDENNMNAVFGARHTVLRFNVPF